MSSISPYAAEMQAEEEEDQAILAQRLENFFEVMNKETERCKQVLIAVSLDIYGTTAMLIYSKQNVKPVFQPPKRHCIRIPPRKANKSIMTDNEEQQVVHSLSIERAEHAEELESERVKNEWLEYNVEMLSQNVQVERERAADLEARLEEVKKTLGKYQRVAQDLRFQLNGIYFTSVLPQFSDVCDIYLGVQ
jgi:hypothetical protein